MYIMYTPQTMAKHNHAITVAVWTSERYKKFQHFWQCDSFYQ